MNKEKVKSTGSTLFVARAGIIAAVYVVLTVFISAFNLASGTIQIRISEALCILPIFTSAAIPGLAIGCFLSNLLTGCAIQDIIFGSLATLIGAIWSYVLRKHKFLATLPPVISNALIVPWVLRYVYEFTFIYKGIDLSIPFFILTVAIGEVISVCFLGTMLRKALEPIKAILFGVEPQEVQSQKVELQEKQPQEAQ